VFLVEFHETPVKRSRKDVGCEGGGVHRAVVRGAGGGRGGGGGAARDTPVKRVRVQPTNLSVAQQLGRKAGERGGGEGGGGLVVEDCHNFVVEDRGDVMRAVESCGEVAAGKRLRVVEESTVEMAKEGKRSRVPTNFYITQRRKPEESVAKAKKKAALVIPIKSCPRKMTSDAGNVEDDNYTSQSFPSVISKNGGGWLLERRDLEVAREGGRVNPDSLVGQTFKKLFPKFGYYDGKVIAYCKDRDAFHVRYNDNDEEDVSYDELVGLMRRKWD
jgi:hypothetical protein